MIGDDGRRRVNVLGRIAFLIESYIRILGQFEALVRRFGRFENEFETFVVDSWRL